MRIGELAKRTHLSRDTIRYYERHGLIRSLPSDGNSNSYRDYFDGTEDILAMVREAQSAGLTIADLVLFIKQLNASSEESFNAEDFLQHKIAEVEERIRRSRKFLKTLKATKDALSPIRTGKIV